MERTPYKKTTSRGFQCKQCLSVHLILLSKYCKNPAPTSLVSTLKMRYIGVCLWVFNWWTFDKSFRLEVMAWKSQYANKHVLIATGFSLFWVPSISRYVNGKHYVNECFLARLTHRGWCVRRKSLTRAVARSYCSETPLAFLRTEASKAGLKAESGLNTTCDTSHPRQWARAAQSWPFAKLPHTFLYVDWFCPRMHTLRRFGLLCMRMLHEHQYM